MVAGRAANVARATRTRAVRLDGLDHRVDHVRVLAHTQIVVGTPDRHIIRAFAVVLNRGKGPALTL